MNVDIDAIRAWIDLVHGNSPGLIWVGSNKNMSGYSYSDVTNVVAAVLKLEQENPTGIYMRTTTLKSVPRDGTRGGDDASLTLPGFAADMDIAGPGHKPVKGSLPASVEDCYEIIQATGLPEPTLWVHSGGGVYPWWLLEEGVDISTPEALAEAQELSGLLHETIARWAAELGCFYSTATKDMARILRIPGTINRKVKEDPKLAQVIQPASYDFYPALDLASRIRLAYANSPAPAEPEIPRPAPVVRTEGSPLRPGDDFNDRAHWADILTPHGWTYMYHKGRAAYWRRPGKDSGEHSASTGREGVGADDRLWCFSDATDFIPNQAYNKFAAYALLNHGGTGATHFASATRDLRAKGFGGELPELHRAVDAVSLVKPAAVPAAVLDKAVDQQQPQEATLAVQANQALPVLDHDGLPSFTTEVYTSQPWDDMGLVSMYSSIFCGGLRYVNSMDEWRVWNGQRWVRDDRQLHQLGARKLATGLRDYARQAERDGNEHAKDMKAAAAKLATMGKVMSVPKLARTDTCMSSTPKDYDKHKYLVTVENGTLDVKTGQLSDFNPDLMLTKKINAVYDPDAKGPRTSLFFSQIQPDVEVLAYMKRLVGATALGHADERVLPIIHGASGSGKSAFLEMLYHVLGDFAAVADPTTLMPQPDNYQGPSEKLHSLMGTRFVKMSELPENASLNQALVKSITGSDTQKTRPLYGHPVEWDVEYVVWMATNNLPKITSTDGAIWKRVKPIHFPNVFVNEDGSVKSAGDRDLGRQLAREEGSFILNWILEGIQEYLEHGLAEPAQIGAWLTGYRDEMDTTRQFITEAQENGQIKIEEGLTIPARDLYKIYLAWAADAQVRFPLSQQTFKQRMQVNSYEQVRVTAGMVWKGIGVAGFIGQAQTPSAQGNQWMGRMRN